MFHVRGRAEAKGEGLFRKSIDPSSSLASKASPVRRCERSILAVQMDLAQKRRRGFANIFFFPSRGTIYLELELLAEVS